jgi:hypothetical protein
VKAGTKKGCWLNNLFYLAIADAGCADVGLAYLTVEIHADLLKVWQPSAPVEIVGVTDPVPDHGTLPTHFTLSTHVVDLPEELT